MSVSYYVSYYVCLLRTMLTRTDLTDNSRRNVVVDIAPQVPSGPGPGSAARARLESTFGSSIMETFLRHSGKESLLLTPELMQ